MGMGVAAAKAPIAKIASAVPECVLAPAPRIHVRSPVHLVQRACDCGSKAGVSGRCEACDRVGLVASRTSDVHHVLPRTPGRGASPPHPQSMVRRHDLAHLSISARPALMDATGQAAASAVSAPLRLTPMPIQRQLRVSSPGDAAEQEAQDVGKRIARMPEPARPAPIRRAQAGIVQRRAVAPTMVHPAVVAGLHSSRSSGTPLPQSVRSFMEPRFGAEFGAVRVHTGAQAALLSSQLNADAFTVGRDVYFNKGQFQPDTTEGRELIAHELAHTIQQGGVIQRSAENTSVTERASESVQRGFFDSLAGALTDPLGFLADKANMIPGFRMLTIVLGVNPINMSRVDASPANILMALIEFIPGGGLVTQALQNSGVFEKAGNWIADQIKGLVATGASLKSAVSAFISSLSLTDLANPSGVWERAKRIFTEPIDRLIAFAKGVVTGILKLIKDAILLPLASLAQGTPSWDLLTGVLGKNPITDEKVERKPEVLIGGFMKLIGQGEVWENIQKSNAASRAWTWFQGAISAVVAFVSQIPGAFVALFNSLTIQDVVFVVGAFQKVKSIFGGFVGNFISWAGNAVWNLLEIIFDVVSPGAFSYVKKTGAALKSILKNPLPFVGNLVKAAKLGFENFANNIGTHLKEGLIDWLTGSLPGVYIPKAMSLVELGKFALSVLGITWAQIRAKIVKALGPKGETIMKGLEIAFDVIKALVVGGVSAAWALIMEKLTSLKDMVIDGIIGFVTDSIIKKAVPKLIAMFVPGAGFISAIISIYDTIKVFIEKLAKIAAVVKSFVDSIVAIAAGEIGGAAARVEGALTGLLSLAISFFAGFVGLGNVASKVMEVIKKVQTAVDKALDAAIDWIVTKAKALFAALFGGNDKDAKPDERTDKQKAQDVESAINEGTALLENDPIAGENAIGRIKQKYRLTELEIRSDPPEQGFQVEHLHGAASPGKDGKKIKIVKILPLASVTFTFNRENKNLDFGEYQGQLNAQAAGLNAMIYEDWRNRRDAYLDRLKKYGSGRDPAGASAQAELRERTRGALVLARIAEFVKQGMTEKAAEKKAERDVDDAMRGVAALHNPDQVIGGDAKEVLELGDRAVNSSIGRAWGPGGKAKELENEIEAKSATIPEKQKQKAKLNVSLPLR
jgi:hypothetical protein